MSGIFISYRRIDTIAWAGRLFDHLSRRFGNEQVFMDIEGGIPRGADFELVLTSKVESCDALLVLIGPEWIGCKHSSGARRLDDPKDWVRNEIATAILRNIFVMPVLFGSAARPEETDLPEDLYPLAKKQCAEVTDTRWDYDVGKLIEDLIKETKLKPLDDIASASNGIRLLNDLIKTVPAVADAVSRSKEVIENTYSQVAKLEFFKTLHDALHTIESDCLRPMKAGGGMATPRAFKIKFTAQARRIQESIQSNEINPALRDDLKEQLELIASAFQEDLDAPGEAAFKRLINELDVLQSSFSSELDAGIVNAAAELKLERLIQLMATVRAQIPSPASEHDAEIEPFTRGIDALKRLCDELARLVAEHTRLQRLDSELRRVCVPETVLPNVGSEWERIKRVRSRISPPFSPALEAANQDLAGIEIEIEVALTDSQQQVFALISEYFEAVRTVFRDVDSSLKDFCIQLSEVSQPLKIILEMCETGR